MKAFLEKQHNTDPASFRDPSGYVFYQDGEIYRYITEQYYPTYQQLRSSGLYQDLVDKGYLIPVEEIASDGKSAVVKPLKIPYISYPFEWSFSQLKAAAQLTLTIQEIALRYGMQLKDASVYNIQFTGTIPIFIDTLSFDPANASIPWVAYKQFCQHFLAPLTLCSFCDPRMKSLFISHLDGIPLDLAKRLIPTHAYFHPCRFLHIWLHELFQHTKSTRQLPAKTAATHTKASSAAFGLVDTLRASITGLKRKSERSIWKSYYSGDSYQEKAFEEKQKIVLNLLSHIKPKMLWDLGSNDGFFTEIASPYSGYSVAMDLDLTCIENMYLRLHKQKNKTILPLHMDITNPSSGTGWNGKERRGFLDRGGCDVALALALVHHLMVSSGIPLHKLVDCFSTLCTNLIIEYIPPGDPKFRQICQTNPNDFSFFTEAKFLSAFEEKFSMAHRIPIRDSERVIYHFQTKFTRKTIC